MEAEIAQLKARIEELERLLFKNDFSDLKIFVKPVQFKSKVGFYGITPIIQASAITAPTGGSTIDSQARTAIGTIITDLKNLGLTA